MDLVLTGRSVEAVEASHIGLVNRLVPPGEALHVSIRLAHELAAFPQECMRADRAAAIEQWDSSSSPEAAALYREWQLGHQVLGGAVRGAARFAGGAGRGGARL